MLISSAFAQAAGATGNPVAGIESFLPLILIFVVFYFMLIRPQQKRMKTHKEMLGGLRRGDRVVTGGGILGTVNKVVSDTEVAVEIAEGVRVRVLKSSISEVLTKPEPVKADAAKDAPAEAAAEGEKPADK